MELTLLTIPGCPHREAFEQRLVQALAGRAATIVRHEVHDAAQAQRLVLRGSPTLLIDGTDPFAVPGEPVGVWCRLYRLPDGSVDGAPSVDQLRAALNGCAASGWSLGATCSVPRSSWGWSSPPHAAESRLKRAADGLRPRSGRPLAVRYAMVIVLIVLAAPLPVRGALPCGTSAPCDDGSRPQPARPVAARACLGLWSAMALHRLDPAPQHTVNVFSAAHEPALTVDSGDTIIVRTLDAVGYLERQEFPGDTAKPKMFDGDFRGHCLCRPVAVRGAEPGDMLKVEIVALTPDTWGWTSSPGVPGSPVATRLGFGEADRATLLWEIDTEAGTATANGKYTRSLAPFLGVTGVAPAGAGEHSTVPPRTEAGGNIDCKELVAGSALYLPVNTESALLYLGDGHGAQGDGESCGTAIECGMTTEAVVSVARERPLSTVHAETPAGLVTFGFSADLNEAMGDALDAMVTWMAARYGTSRPEALALASTCVDLRITQVVNVTWGVHALLPTGVLS